jgi:hypothetical protein
VIVLSLALTKQTGENAGEMAQLDRSMKSRHLNMIAIGGSIGAGFFVGSGNALTKGGPASVLICFLISGVMIFNVVYALGELAVMYPVSGGFYTYSIRFIDPSWGFAMGWNYVSSNHHPKKSSSNNPTGPSMVDRLAAGINRRLLHGTVLEQRHKRGRLDYHILGFHHYHQRIRYSWLC